MTDWDADVYEWVPRASSHRVVPSHAGIVTATTILSRRYDLHLIDGQVERRQDLVW